MATGKNKFDVSKSPFVLMPILLIMWGSLAAVSKLLLNHLDSYQILFYMYGLGAVVFLVIYIFKMRLVKVLSWKMSEIILLLSCGILTFLYDFFYLKSLELIPAVEASMLNYLFPLFIIIFAIPIHNEKLNSYKIISILMGCIGTVLLITKGDFTKLSFTNFNGDLFAILAAISWGLFTNLIKKNNKDMLMSTLFITAVAFILSAGVMFTYSNFMLPQALDFYGVLWLSMSNIVLGFFLYFRALKYSPASLIASFTFFSPFVTLVFIILLLGERLTVVDCIAALLIIFSVSIQSVANSKVISYGKRRR